eukprot:6177399-Pleurochrysis_carterae.AAC.6
MGSGEISHQHGESLVAARQRRPNFAVPAFAAPLDFEHAHVPLPRLQRRVNNPADMARRNHFGSSLHLLKLLSLWRALAFRRGRGGRHRLDNL